MLRLRRCSLQPSIYHRSGSSRHPRAGEGQHAVPGEIGPRHAAASPRNPRGSLERTGNSDAVAAAARRKVASSTTAAQPPGQLGASRRGHSRRRARPAPAIRPAALGHSPPFVGYGEDDHHRRRQHRHRRHSSPQPPPPAAPVDLKANFPAPTTRCAAPPRTIHRTRFSSKAKHASRCTPTTTSSYAVTRPACPRSTPPSTGCSAAILQSTAGRRWREALTTAAAPRRLRGELAALPYAEAAPVARRGEHSRRALQTRSHLGNESRLPAQLTPRPCRTFCHPRPREHDLFVDAYRLGEGEALRTSLYAKRAIWRSRRRRHCRPQPRPSRATTGALVGMMSSLHEVPSLALVLLVLNRIAFSRFGNGLHLRRSFMLYAVSASMSYC